MASTSIVASAVFRKALAVRTPADGAANQLTIAREIRPRRRCGWRRCRSCSSAVAGQRTPDRVAGGRRGPSGRSAPPRGAGRSSCGYVMPVSWEETCHRRACRERSCERAVDSTTTGLRPVNSFQPSGPKYSPLRTFGSVAARNVSRARWRSLRLLSSSQCQLAGDPVAAAINARTPNARNYCSAIPTKIFRSLLGPRSPRRSGDLIASLPVPARVPIPSAASRARTLPGASPRPAGCPWARNCCSNWSPRTRRRGHSHGPVLRSVRPSAK